MPNEEHNGDSGSALWYFPVDMMHLPWISYFVSWRNVGMLNMIAVAATLVCLAAAIVCWYQIATTEED